mgnify:CR=1 FL=1
MEQELTGEQTSALISIINSVKDHLSIVDRQYRYQVVNDAYLRATCRRRDDGDIARLDGIELGRTREDVATYQS